MHGPSRLSHLAKSSSPQRKPPKVEQFQYGAWTISTVKVCSARPILDENILEIGNSRIKWEKQRKEKTRGEVKEKREVNVREGWVGE
jgi:hypothetical protein